MSRQHPLSDGERGTLVNALRVAIDVYKVHKGEMEKAGHNRLAEQFQRQVDDLWKLVEQIEETTSISITFD